MNLIWSQLQLACKQKLSNKHSCPWDVWHIQLFIIYMIKRNIKRTHSISVFRFVPIEYSCFASVGSTAPCNVFSDWQLKTWAGNCSCIVSRSTLLCCIWADAAVLMIVVSHLIWEFHTWFRAKRLWKCCNRQNLWAVYQSTHTDSSEVPHLQNKQLLSSSTDQNKCFLARFVLTNWCDWFELLWKSIWLLKETPLTDVRLLELELFMATLCLSRTARFGRKCFSLLYYCAPNLMKDLTGFMFHNVLSNVSVMLCQCISLEPFEQIVL